MLPKLKYVLLFSLSVPLPLSGSFTAEASFLLHCPYLISSETQNFDPETSEGSS